MEDFKVCKEEKTLFSLFQKQTVTSVNLARISLHSLLVYVDRQNQNTREYSRRSVHHILKQLLEEHRDSLVSNHSLATRMAIPKGTLDKIVPLAKAMAPEYSRFLAIFEEWFAAGITGNDVENSGVKVNKLKKIKSWFHVCIFQHFRFLTV